MNNNTGVEMKVTAHTLLLDAVRCLAVAPLVVAGQLGLLELVMLPATSGMKSGESLMLAGVLDIAAVLMFGCCLLLYVVVPSV